MIYIFAFFCLCLIVYLSSKYNRLLRAYEKTTKDANDLIKSHWELTQRFSRFVKRYDLIDEYVAFEEKQAIEKEAK